MLQALITSLWPGVNDFVCRYAGGLLQTCFDCSSGMRCLVHSHPWSLACHTRGVTSSRGHTLGQPLDHQQSLHHALLQSYSQGVGRAAFGQGRGGTQAAPPQLWLSAPYCAGRQGAAQLQPGGPDKGGEPA